MKQEQLARTVFPLGGMENFRVRDLAAAFKLPVAKKRESQEICFIPDNDYVRFLEESGVAAAPGDLVDRDGKRLGSHTGIHKFTLGQRRGLGIAWKEPLYVTAIDRKSAQVTVGPRPELFRSGLTARGCSWTGVPPAGLLSVSCSIGYRQKPFPCTARLQDDGRLVVDFLERQVAVTPGQAVVIYDGERVLGGGWIE